MWWNARTRWSEAAFDAEYGELGAYGVVSLNLPVSPRVPYTSSVDTCRKRNAAPLSAGSAFQ
ncbi:hypothetical protein D9M71_782790 [compost metagenome]